MTEKKANHVFGRYGMFANSKCHNLLLDKGN